MELQVAILGARATFWAANPNLSVLPETLREDPARAGVWIVRRSTTKGNYYFDAWRNRTIKAPGNFQVPKVKQLHDFRVSEEGVPEYQVKWAEKLDDVWLPAAVVVDDDALGAYWLQFYAPSTDSDDSETPPNSPQHPEARPLVIWDFRTSLVEGYTVLEYRVDNREPPTWVSANDVVDRQQLTDHWGKLQYYLNKMSENAAKLKA
jgi:hypothetical protein